MTDESGIQGVLIEEVLGAEQLSDGSRALIVRSGGGTVGLVFSEELADAAAEALSAAAGNAA